MEKIIRFFFLVTLLCSCEKKVSLSESKEQAKEFFNGNLPREVSISKDIKGEQSDLYEVQKHSFTFKNRNIKIFYTVSSSGKLGNIYTEGFNLNTANTTTAAAMTKNKFDKELAKCTTAKCVIDLIKAADRDCQTFKDEANCWFCKSFGGEEDCSWLDQ